MELNEQGAPQAPNDKILFSSDDLGSFAAELEGASMGLPQRINADPANIERGRSRLVLTLVELLRQLLERQALRRMEAGSLCDAEIERLGETFMKLEARMAEVKQTFGLRDEDLNLNLGPLGNLL